MKEEDLFEAGMMLATAVTPLVQLVVNAMHRVVGNRATFLRE